MLDKTKKVYTKSNKSNGYLTVIKDAYISFMLHWFGDITVGDVSEGFSISNENARYTLDEWIKNNPGECNHEERSKNYTLNKNQEPKNSKEALAYIRAQFFLNFFRNGLGVSLDGRHKGDKKKAFSFYDADHLYDPPVNQQHLKSILTSIRQKKSVTLSYYDKQGNYSDRIVSMFRLVHVLNRYHVRAFDHSKKEFRDFVISRIKNILINEESRIDLFDKDFEEEITLKFLPNSSLNPETSVSLLNEWNLEEGKSLEIKCKKALSKYIIRKMTRANSNNEILWIESN